jgi:acyl carrier protein
MEDLRDRVSRVIARQFRVADERVTEMATLDEDLGATSLDRIEVIMSLEDEFRIDISDHQASRLHTVADVLACVMASIGEGRTAVLHRPI